MVKAIEAGIRKAGIVSSEKAFNDIQNAIFVVGDDRTKVDALIENVGRNNRAIRVELEEKLLQTLTLDTLNPAILCQ